jgi:hypothetical protein
MKDNVRGRRERKDHHQGSRMERQGRLALCAGIMLLAVGALLVVNVRITQADDQSLPSMAINYQNGTITAIHEKTLDIDGRTYGVTPDIVVLDEHGDMLDPGRLIVSAEVKFHVKKEQSNMIEKMIVKLPK